MTQRSRETDLEPLIGLVRSDAMRNCLRGQNANVVSKVLCSYFKGTDRARRQIESFFDQDGPALVERAVEDVYG